jgi:hypothetical protein
MSDGDIYKELISQQLNRLIDKLQKEMETSVDKSSYADVVYQKGIIEGVKRVGQMLCRWPKVETIVGKKVQGD